MYSKELIEFFKRHNLYDEEMFRFFSKHTYIIDYYGAEEQRVAIGVGANSKEKFTITIPFQVDYKTTLIAIHELVHAIVEYKHLEKEKNISLMDEALPILYEKLYVNEVNNPSLDKYSEFLDDINTPYADHFYRIDNYRFALWAREYLLAEYNNNFDDMEELAKKLVIKYQNEKNNSDF